MDEATARDTYLKAKLGFFQQLEVWDEPGRIRFYSDATKVELAYQNLLTTNTPEIVINGNVKQTDELTVDYPNGVVTVGNDLVDGDTVKVSYKFAFFTDAELNAFLAMSIADLNNVRPETGFTIATMPNSWLETLVENAYRHAMQRISTDLCTWKARLIFSDPAQVQSLMQAAITTFLSMWPNWVKRLKGRVALIPRAVASGRWRVPRVPDNYNFQQFTIVRAL